MGLFIGASILTILEIFDYLYEVRQAFKRPYSLSFLICKALDLMYLNLTIIRSVGVIRGDRISQHSFVLFLALKQCLHLIFRKLK